MAKKSTPKKKVIAKATTKKAVKKAASKSKPVTKKKIAKPKQVKKAKAKAKIALQKVTKKKVVVKVKAKKPVVKAKKTVAKKPVVKAKKPIAKKPVKKAVVKKAIKKVAKKPVVLKTKPKVKKPVVKKVIAVKKQAPVKKEVVKTPVQKVIEKIIERKIIQRPKIVALKDAQKFEANYNRANMFYKNVLKAEIIKRYSCSNKEDHELISKDKNLAVKINDRELSISEKNRDQDWNDIYVEIFRKYPDEEGWIRSTEADYLAYFFPGRVFWAKMEPIKMLCFDILSKAIDSGIYKELYYMYPRNSGRLSKTFKINTKTYSFNFIQTYHENGENSHYSIGISLPFVLLMDFRIDYKIFKQ